MENEKLSLEEMQELVSKLVNKYNLETIPEIRYIDLTSEIGELGKELLKGTNYGKQEFEKTDNLESENTENTSTQANNNDYSDFNIIKENTEQQNNDMPKASINEELYSSQLNNDKNIGNSINNNIKNESAEDDLEYENKKEFSNNQKKSSDVKFRDNIIKSNDSTFKFLTGSVSISST